MLMFTIFTILYLFLIIFELLPLYKEKKKKEALIYSCILTASYVLNTLLIVGVNIPSVNMIILDFLKKINL